MFEDQTLQEYKIRQNIIDSIKDKLSIQIHKACGQGGVQVTLYWDGKPISNSETCINT